MDQDRTPWLREQALEREQLISAIREVLSTKGWKFLKERVFDGAVEALEKKLNVESKKSDPDVKELIRLNSQLVSAKKFTDLDSMENLYMTELQGIRKQLPN